MAQNEKSASDLDVFEGLGKKGTSGPPLAGHSVPPPPPTSTHPPPPAADLGKRTLSGIVAATPVQQLPSGTTTGVVRTPPPPPGRSSLPPVVAPPKIVTPVPADGATAKPGVNVEWDDDDEATQIFDEAHSEASQPAASHAKSVPGKATLLGVPAPGTPVPLASHPPSVSRIPPPPAASPTSGPMRVASLPAPPAGTFPPPPPATQPGLGSFPARASNTPTLPPRGSFGPPPAFGPPPGIGAHQGSLSPPAAVPEYFPPRAGGMESTALLRPAPTRTGLWIVVGLAAAAILAVAVVFVGTPRTGQIVVNVNDAKGASVNRVDIFVDGRKQCETAPCLVEQVAAGSHEVKVVADGFPTAAVQTVAVEGRKEASATFTLGSARGSGLKVVGSQPGVKLYVDGKEVGPLPQEVHDLSPGEHTIKIAGSERYDALEKRIAIEKDQVADLGSVQLKVLHGKATISLMTPGARVYLVSGSDRRELPMLPISVDIDTTKAWSLEASKPGFDDYRQPISFDDGQAEKSITVNLEPRAMALEPRAQAPVYAAAPPPAAPAPAPAPPPPVAAPAAAAAEGGEAYLNINSIPPSTCFVDGRSLGTTPRIHVSVKAGTHSVKFINADQGLTKTITVSVGAGETKPAVAKLN